MAQGFLDAVFGSIDRAVRRESQLPPRMNSYSDPYGMYERRRERPPAYSAGEPRPVAEHRGPSSGFCVRTCDGLHFPVKSSGNMTAVEMCRAFCPAAKTKVFGGSKIDYSVAADGQRYTDLDNAFLYRERRVDNCTCNGKDSYGLATLKTEIDPTLRPGDIVATNDGLATYTGKSAEFTPIGDTGGSSEWRRRLMSIKVTPAPPRVEIQPVPAEEKAKDQRRAQR